MGRPLWSRLNIQNGHISCFSENVITICERVCCDGSAFDSLVLWAKSRTAGRRTMIASQLISCATHFLWVAVGPPCVNYNSPNLYMQLFLFEKKIKRARFVIKLVFLCNSLNWSRRWYFQVLTGDLFITLRTLMCYFINQYKNKIFNNSEIWYPGYCF